MCNNETKFCQRTLKSEAEPGTGKPLDVCKLNCNPETGSLFPLPTGTVCKYIETCTKYKVMFALIGVNFILLGYIGIRVNGILPRECGHNWV